MYESDPSDRDYHEHNSSVVKILKKWFIVEAKNMIDFL